MPDGREAWTPLSPGANPSYGAENNGLLASLNSVAKLPYEWALDGISNTQTINPTALGENKEERKNCNLCPYRNDTKNRNRQMDRTDYRL